MSKVKLSEPLSPAHMHEVLLSPSTTIQRTPLAPCVSAMRRATTTEGEEVMNKEKLYPIIVNAVFAVVYASAVSVLLFDALVWRPN